MKKFLILLSAVITITACGDRVRTVHIVTTGDVHGSWFSRDYVDSTKTNSSLLAVSNYVNTLRKSVGRKNVVLLDAGDCLQGNNAAYYYNYIATGEEHLFPRLCEYMGYDIVTVGNHDIETGHGVYDKVARELKKKGIPMLAANTPTPDGGNYFQEYKLLRKGGMKILVIGFTNANMKAWLSEEIWEGMEFTDLMAVAQTKVDSLQALTKPDITIVSVHSGTGNGHGSVLESQGLDLYNSLENVDLVVTSHDHSPLFKCDGSKALVNGGARAEKVGYCMISAEFSHGKITGKKVKAKIQDINKDDIDLEMERKFQKEFEAVQAFTLQEIGTLGVELRTRDAYKGMAPYLNLIHTVQLGVPEAKISFAAPLTFDGTVKSGTLIYNDLFTIYPYENTLFVVNLSGKEIKDALEYSYDNWVRDFKGHILKILPLPDPRNKTEKWSFLKRPYNFDSAAGINYTVDFTKTHGNRIKITSFADGSKFEMDAIYPVAMTSYRANGGGSTIPEGAGVSNEEIKNRIVAKYPEIRELIYKYILEHHDLSEESFSDPAVLGTWKFIPEKKAQQLLEDDFKLLFGE